MSLNKIIILITSLLVIGTSFSQEKGYNYFRKQTKIKDPFKLRDPFKRKFSKRKKSKKFSTSIGGNSFSNIPSVENIPLNRIVITAVLLGKNRRAIAQLKGATGTSKTTYIVKEGMNLGENKAEVKAILPGGVVLVEKIRNVYDQDEYLETILPIQNPTVSNN